ncbi:uncharacterized protein [Dermacentor albipictus]|uniref:uncharacterized protein n=1 Tax=Dermacentor albipictus TaxID=60249 RepID=UPI0031FE1C6F
MIVHHAGCSLERIEPESASVGYSVRYTGIAVCSVLGVATVVLSLFLFTKLVLKASDDASARRRMRVVERGGLPKENATSRPTTKSLDDLIRSFFSHSPTDGDDRLSRATRQSHNDSAYRPHLEAAAAENDGNDDVQIPYVAPQAASTESPTTTTPSALGLGGGTQASRHRARFYGRKSHLEDGAFARLARTVSSDDSGGDRLGGEDSGSYRVFGEI